MVCQGRRPPRMVGTGKHRLGQTEMLFLRPDHAGDQPWRMFSRIMNRNSCEQRVGLPVGQISFNLARKTTRLGNNAEITSRSPFEQRRCRGVYLLVELHFRALATTIS